MARSARSTARFISYDLRPAKQSERIMLIDVLRIGGDCGLPMRDYRYIGMGANRFYDFLLLHKYLGLKDMVSLEHDPIMYERAVFNVPYRFIDVRHTSVTSFLAEDRGEKPEVLWLDYDGGIGAEIAADIISVSTRMKLGDYCFITVAGLAPPALDEKNDEDRLTLLREAIGDLAGSVSIEDVQRANFPRAVHKVLMAAFKNGFAQRREGIFVPLMQVQYADTMQMVTVGGAFIATGTAADYCAKMRNALPFLDTKESKLYEIRSFNITERERSLFDRVATAGKTRSAEVNILKKLGFKDVDFKAYNELLRHLPKYVEVAI